MLISVDLHLVVTFQIDKEKAKSSQKEVENFVRWLENEKTLGLTQLFSRFDKLDALAMDGIHQTLRNPGCFKVSLGNAERQGGNAGFFHLLK